MRLTKLVLSQCFLRRLPSKWSVSQEDYQRAAVFYFGVFWTVQFLLIGDPAEAFIATVSEWVLTQIFVSVVLAMVKRRHTFLPMATLLMGAVGWVGLFAIPFVVWLRLAEDTMLLVAFYATLVFPVWGIVVLGHVFRQALAKTPSFGFGVACAYAVEAYLGTLILLVL